MKSTIRFMAVVVIVFLAVGLHFAQAAINGAQSREGAGQKTIGGDGVTTMVLSENDLGQIAQKMTEEQLKGFIKSASIKIFDGYLEVTAVAEKPISATLFVRAQINVADGKLYPKILKMRYGFFPVPNFLMNFLIGRLVGQNSQNFQSTGVAIPGVEVQSIDLKNGQAAIAFKEMNK